MEKISARILFMASRDSERIIQFVRDPSLEQVELRFSQYALPVFHRHNHEAYSIGLVKKGGTRFHLVQHAEVIHPVRQGDVVLINPGEVHACNPESGRPFAYYMLYIGPQYFQSVLEDLCDRPIPEYRFPIPVIRNADIRAQLDDLCREMTRGGTRLAVESTLHETLAAILHQIGTGNSSTTESTNSANVQAGYDYLREHLPENISLQELAALCHLSTFHFLRAFRGRYGLPPHTCQLQMRINQARRLLASGESIASTAAAVGFADQSHFTRAFRSSVGTTPRQYKDGVRLEINR